MTVLCLAPNAAIASWFHTSLCIIIYTVYNMRKCFLLLLFCFAWTPHVSYLTTRSSHLCVVTISSFLRCQKCWSWAKLCLLKLCFQCTQRQFTLSVMNVNSFETQHCCTQWSSNTQLLGEEVKVFSDRRDDLNKISPTSTAHRAHLAVWRRKTFIINFM